MYLKLEAKFIKDFSNKLFNSSLESFLTNRLGEETSFTFVW